MTLKMLVQMLNTHIYICKAKAPNSNWELYCTLAFIHIGTEEALLSLQEFYLLEVPYRLSWGHFQRGTKEKKQESSNEKNHFGFQLRKIKQMSAVLWESSVKLNNADAMAVCNYDSI